MKKPTILILAAGNSSRMGSQKQLLPFKKSTLLGTVIQQCIATNTEDIYCVLGANATEIEAKNCNTKIHFIHNTNYLRGLSTSIVKAVEVIIKKEPETSSILIVLADQPFITEAYLNQYLNLHKQKSSQVIATTYPDKIGVPALFPKKYLDALLSLKGDYGAKKLLVDIEDKLLITLPEDILTDIDTQEDYTQALNKITQ